MKVEKAKTPETLPLFARAARGCFLLGSSSVRLSWFGASPVPACMHKSPGFRCRCRVLASLLPSQESKGWESVSCWVLLTYFTCLVCFQVVEFDTPSALLANENSRFYAMFAAAENKVAVKG